jgi:MFS family permease
MTEATVTAPTSRRWRYVLFGAVIMFSLGTVYSWSVFVKPLTDYFTGLGLEVKPGSVLLPFSVFLAAFAVAMAFSGKYIEKFGPRNVSIAGGLLCGLGWVLASLARSPAALIPAYGIVGGLGVGMVYGCPVAVAARWFPDRRGLAVGLTVMGFGFSAFITANLASLLIESAGVMAAFRFFGLGIGLLIVLFSLPLSFPPPDYTCPPARTASTRPGSSSPTAAPSTSSSQSTSCNLTRREMLRTTAFYGLWLCFFIGCLAGLMGIAISKPVGTELISIGSRLASFLVGFFALFNGGGRPGFGALTDRLTPRWAAVLSFVLIGAASLLMWLAAGPGATAVYIIAFALLWACLGGWLAIAPAATASFFGTADYPRNYGVVFLAYGAGALAGPMLAGFIRNKTGSYTGVFPYVAALALVGLVVAVTTLKPPVARSRTEAV